MDAAFSSEGHRFESWIDDIRSMDSVELLQEARRHYYGGPSERFLPNPFAAPATISCLALSGKGFFDLYSEPYQKHLLQQGHYTNRMSDHFFKELEGSLLRWHEEVIQVRDHQPGEERRAIKSFSEMDCPRLFWAKLRDGLFQIARASSSLSCLKGLLDLDTHEPTTIVEAKFLNYVSDHFIDECGPVRGALYRPCLNTARLIR